MILDTMLWSSMAGISFTGHLRSKENGKLAYLSAIMNTVH